MMKKLFQTILLLSYIFVNLSNGLFATQITDSLEIILKNSKADSTKARILNILSWNYKSIDTKKAWDYSKEALRLANEQNLIIEQGAAYNNIGSLYYLVTKLDSAIFYFDMAHKLFEKAGNKSRSVRSKQNVALIYNDKSDYKKAIEIYNSILVESKEIVDSMQKANLYNNIGNSYNLMGDYDKAMEYFLDAIEYYEKLGAKENLSTVYYNIGALQYYRSNFEKALDYADQSLKIREEIKNPYGIAYSYILKGAIFEGQQNHDKALEAYQYALKIDRELNDLQGIATLLLNIANVNINKNNLTEARKYSLEALTEINKTGIIKLKLSIYNNIADIEVRLDNYKEALKYYGKTAVLADSTGDKMELRYAYNGMFKTYELMQDYKNAFIYQSKYLVLNDSIFNSEKDKQLTEMDTKYQSEKKEKEIELLNKDKKLQEIELEKKAEQVNKQRIIIYGAIVVIIIILIFIILIFRLYRQNKKMNNTLIIQNEEILQKNEEITAQSEEILSKNEELNQRNEEILSQRDEIERQHNIVVEQKRLITDSINYASNIQGAILKPISFVRELLPESFILFKPKDVVGGDFYWYKQIVNKCLIVVADCTGHGVPGAFMTLIGNAGLNQIVALKGIENPAVILNELNIYVKNTLQQNASGLKADDGMDAGICFIDVSNRKLVFSGAKISLFHYKNNDINEYKGDKCSLGYKRSDDSFIFNNLEIKVDENESFYMTSDGFIDISYGENEFPLGKKKFKNMILKNIDKPMDVQGQILENFLVENSNSELVSQRDDLTVIGFKI